MSLHLRLNKTRQTDWTNQTNQIKQVLKRIKLKPEYYPPINIHTAIVFKETEDIRQ